MRAPLFLTALVLVACSTPKFNALVPIGGACTKAGSCASAGVCANNVCRVACSSDTTCGTHEACLSGACIPVVCGDGVIMATEACDDGNTKSSDGCSATCKVEAEYACSGEPSQCVPCSDPDPLNCTLAFSWTDWTDYDDCSASCGEGTHTRTRQCLRTDGNFVDCAYCGGSCTQTAACSAPNACPPTYSAWTDWSACSGGMQTRTRTCDAPDGGGVVDCSGCGGDCSETQTCVECSSFGINVVNCNPGPPGDQPTCNSVIAQAHTNCLNAGCSWTGPVTCTVGGSQSTTMCYGATGSCQ